MQMKMEIKLRPSSGSNREKRREKLQLHAALQIKAYHNHAEKVLFWRFMYLYYQSRILPQTTARSKENPNLHHHTTHRHRLRALLVLLPTALLAPAVVLIVLHLIVAIAGAARLLVAGLGLFAPVSDDDDVPAALVQDGLFVARGECDWCVCE